MQRRGVRVTVISSIASHPPMIADQLRRQADAFVDLATLQSKVGRAAPERLREPAHDARPQLRQPASSTL
jgi:uncharacterized LabA/DUF88 family protein